MTIKTRNWFSFKKEGERYPDSTKAEEGTL